MLAIIDPEDAYELHMNLIRHGREVCLLKPRCTECGLRRMRPWYRSARYPRRRSAGSTRGTGSKHRRNEQTHLHRLRQELPGLVYAIPWLAFRSTGRRGDCELKVPEPEGRTGPFQTNCGTCHTLYAAGTDGNDAPNLDELLAPSGPPSGPTAASTIKETEGRVLNALEHGVDTTTTPGRCPPGSYPNQGKEVAEFVAHRRRVAPRAELAEPVQGWLSFANP